ncbi:DNA-binding response regulator [Streptomyces tauricus]|uniref:Response regulator transcription factor n=2 Tax=Streptomyces tauricus TaxID=68274 RepID=A0ABZ1JBB9_9ACTN|nr:response regulator transcription factor [Streptomyces tauricus]MCW8101028.1 response regulator transcription factor [Streptomyces tauricus]GHA20284.1 DNA-binding response regulator [Streptomyces tauricus]
METTITPITLVLADDEAMIRAGVKAILATDPEIDVVAEAANGREAITLTLEHRPDVVLMDIRMPVMDGLAATAEIKRQVPQTSVLVLTTFSEDAYVARALGDGASGFMLKSGDPRELLTGVHAAAAGASYLSAKVAERVISELNRSSGGQAEARSAAAQKRVSALTEREQEVLALVGSGLSNADIGRRLHVVEGTVKSYVSAIFTALGVRNRVQAAIIAYEAGVVADQDK